MYWSQTYIAPIPSLFYTYRKIVMSKLHDILNIPNMVLVLQEYYKFINNKYRAKEKKIFTFLFYQFQINIDNPY